MPYYLKKFWKINMVVILFQILSHMMLVCASLVSIQTAQAAIDFDFHAFIFWVSIQIAAYIFELLLSSLKTMFQSRAVRVMNNAVRQDIAASLLRKDYEDYHSRDRGEYLSWFTTGVDQIEQNAWNSFFSFTSYTAQVLTNIIALLRLHWSFLPVVLVSSVLMSVVPKLPEKRLERLGEECAKGQEAAVSNLKGLLGGYDVLKFFGRIFRFSSGVGEASDQIEKTAYRRNSQTGFIYGGIGIVNAASQLLINLYSALLAFKSIVPMSVFFGCGQMCSSVSNGLNQLAYYRLCFSTSKPYFSRITVHDGDVRPQSAQGADPIREAITVEDLCFRYGDKKVLENMTATFKKGGKYALVGPSGCGKSTLLKLILGWLPDYSGDIRFDGKSARNYTPDQLQQQMSYIAQDVFLFNTTIRDNITLGEMFTDAQMEKALQDSALAGDLANMPLGLDTPVGEEGDSLSGGQRQRVAIARALIHKRSILLVDEGTSALDQKNANIVEESLLANSELTLILVSHHLTPERQAQFDGVYQLETVTA